MLRILIIPLLFSWLALEAQVSGGAGFNYGANFPIGTYGKKTKFGGNMDAGINYSFSAYLGIKQGIGVVGGINVLSNQIDLQSILQGYEGGEIQCGDPNFTYGGPFIGLFYGFHIDKKNRFLLLFDAFVGQAWFAYPQISIWKIDQNNPGFTKIFGYYYWNGSGSFRAQFAWYPSKTTFNISFGIQLFMSTHRVLIYRDSRPDYRFSYPITTIAATLGIGFLKFH